MKNQNVKMKKNKNGTYKVWWDEYDNMNVRHQRSKTLPVHIEACDFRVQTIDRLRKKINLKEHITFGQYCERYFNEYIKDIKKPNTEYSYVTQFRRIMPELGNIKLRELSSAQLQSFLNGLAKEGLKKTTVAAFYQKLNTVLKQAFYDDIIIVSPMLKVRMPSFAANYIPDNESENDVLTLKQTIEFLEFIKPTPLYPVVLITVFTGLRRGEASALRWDDIDFATGKFKVDKAEVDKIGFGIVTTTPKTKSSVRTITLPPSALKELKSIRNNCYKLRVESGYAYNPMGYIWVSPSGEHYSLQTLTNFFHDYYLEFKKQHKGLPHMTFHKLRHTHTALMRQAGADLKVTSARLGHSSTRITDETYDHVSMDEKREAGLKLDRLMNL